MQLTKLHYDDVIMSAIASQITSLTIVYSIVYSDADQRKHQSSASLAIVWGIHRGPVNSPHKWPVTRKMVPFDDVIMGQYHTSAFTELMPHSPPVGNFETSYIESPLYFVLSFWMTCDWFVIDWWYLLSRWRCLDPYVYKRLLLSMYIYISSITFWCDLTLTYDQVLQWSTNAIVMIAFLPTEADEGCYFDQLTTSSPQMTMKQSVRWYFRGGDSGLVNDNSDSIRYTMILNNGSARREQLRQILIFNICYTMMKSVQVSL